jgi:protein SCO1/2
MNPDHSLPPNSQTKQTSKWPRRLRIAAIGIVGAIAVAVTIGAIDPALLGVNPSDILAKVFGPPHDSQTATTTNSEIPPGAPIGGAFQLTNQFGQPVTDATYHGKYMLVFFGDSHCPDDCPLTLEKMALTMNALGPLAQHITPVFITIDPTRDTSPVLKTYLAEFSPSLIGLTGNKTQIASVAHEYDVSFNTNDFEASGASLISHSTYLYLMGPDGKFLNLFPFTITVAQLTSALKTQASQ